MVEQAGLSFGESLRRALAAARWTQAKLGEELAINASQVSRWATNKAVPHRDTVSRIGELLGEDLSDAFAASAPTHELYISAPICGLADPEVAKHHDEVATVVESLRLQANSLYWPGEPIRSLSDLKAPDIATETNLNVIGRCAAFVYLQFADVVHPSGSFIELGIALGRRLKTTIILKSGVRHAFMLDGFSAVAERVSFLPNARIYDVKSPEQACELIERNGRVLLGLT